MGTYLNSVKLTPSSSHPALEDPVHTWTRLALVVGVTAAIIGGGTLLALPSDATLQPASDAPAVVRVDAVERAPETRTVRLHGLTRAQERATLAFTSGGRLVARPVDVGDRVAAGDVLARLDPAPLRHQVARAEAQLADLEARLHQVSADRARLEALDEGDAVAPAERERLQSQERSLQASVEQAQVGVAEARRQQAEGVLRAPHDAEIVAVLAEPGETLSAGRPLISLAGVGMEVALEAPESVWATAAVGDAATVSLPGLDCQLPATISRVGAGAAGPQGLFPVQVALGETTCPLAPGLAAAVDLHLPVAPALAVPVRAVLDPTGSGAAVLRVRDGHVERVPITPLRLVDSRVAVEGDLVPGDQVVTAGLVGLVHGEPVQVIR